MAEDNQSSKTDRLSRHGLVMALWAPAIFVAAVLFHAGYLYAANWWFVGAFTALVLAFCAHIIVNVVSKTGFTEGEVALGSVILVCLTVVYLITILTAPNASVDRLIIPVGLGLGALVVFVAVSMVISFGPRRAFEKFDIIRDNNLRKASHLTHRGGRR